MGREKYIRETEALFKKSPVVDFKSVARLVKSKKNAGQYTKQLVRNLLLKGRIKWLAKGYYTIHDDPSLAVFCFAPAYLGLQDALSFHGAWEQETIPVIITSRRVRPGMRRIIGTNVLVRRIDRKYLFGFDYCEQGEFHLPYSDLEKTLIDMLYFKENLSDGTIKAVAKGLDRKKLESYLRKYPKAFRERVRALMPSTLGQMLT